MDQPSAEGRSGTEVRCWGSKPGPGNLRSWTRMQRGHWGLLYAGGGECSMLMPVIHKSQSAALAEHLWRRDEEGRTFELMFYFGDPQPTSLSIDDIRSSLGYDESWWPQGLQYPTPVHQEALLEKFGSLDAFVAASAQGQVVQTDSTKTAAELVVGGIFKGAPTSPPKAPQPRSESNPDADAVGRGYMAHERTVEALAKHVGSDFRKGTPGINHDGCWKSGGSFQLAEVKSTTSANEVHQLQKGLGQILHNCFKASFHGITDLTGYLVAEREPANSALWRDLCSQHGIVFTWPGSFAEDVPASDDH